MTLLAGLLKAMRPKQWVKNGLLFPAIVFSQRYSDLEAVRSVLLGFVLFCMLSSSGYLVNDLRDVEQDRAHPRKKERPIASGVVPVPIAWAFAFALMAAGLGLGFALLGRGFGVVAAGYLAVTLSYTLAFKHVVLLDVMLIASGFILRAVAGAAAIPVESSPWFLTCISFGALFLGLSKRLGELRLLRGDAGKYRKILEDYSEELLEKLINIVASCTLISYALYTFTSGHDQLLMLTIPFIIYGLFRYMYLVDKHDAGGSPTQTLVTDRPLQICIALFVLTAVLTLRLGG